MIDAPRLFLIDAPALAAEQDVNTSIAVAHAGLADVLDALFEAGLSGASRFIVIGGCVDLKNPAGTPDGNIPFTTNHVDQLAPGVGDLHPAISGSPLVERRVANTVLPAQLVS